MLGISGMAQTIGSDRWKFFLGGLAASLTLAMSGCTLGVEEEKLSQVVEQSQVSPLAGSKQDPALPQPASGEEQDLDLQDLTVREEQGQTIIVITFSRAVTQYRHFPLALPSRLVLDVFGKTRRPDQAQTFRADTNWVGVLRLTSSESYLRLTMEIAAATVPPYVISPEDGGLKIVIGAVQPAAPGKRELSFVRGGERVDLTVAERDSPPGRAKTQASAAPDAGAEEKQYTGQKISLDFKDADIRNVFRLLAEISGLNIVVTSDVNRKVTVRLVDVPWDQVLDLIIDTNGLGKEQIGNVIRISTAAQLKAEKDALAAAKRAKEDLEPLQTAYLNINYAKVKELEPKIKSLLTKRGTIVSDERSNSVMVRDIKQSIEDVNALVSRLDTRTPQVLIESNLIETTPTFARALGLRFQFTRSGATFSSAAGAGVPFAGNTAAFPNAPTGLGGTISVIQDSVGGLRNLAGALEAAEREGNIEIISRPSVVTLNNVSSTIQSLRIIRVSLPTSTNIATGTGAAAGAAVATEKINVGIILTVTPQVSSDGFVLMSISVKSSSVADSPTATGEGVIPFDELSREAISNVLVRDGETIVIGGIMKDTRATSESGVPYLKDIPLLGWLFKNIRWQKDFEELMVFITPRIVAAGSENLPTAEQLWREQMKKTQGG